jgi:hypothetical protein
MRRQDVERWLALAYFVIFFVYGGLLMVALTSLFWEWSGMASIGTFFLITIAPFIMLVLAMVLWPSRTKNKFHRYAFSLSAIYALIVGIAFAICSTRISSRG